MNSSKLFFGWTDESSQNKGRYRAIGMVSHPAEFGSELEGDINSILDSVVDESGLKRRELKWNKIDIFRCRAYEKIVDYFLELSNLGNPPVRVDILRWDIEDSRHSIQGRDDNQNLQRMYYHLFSNVISKRWPSGDWCFFPDETGSVDWEEVAFFLDIGGSKVDLKEQFNILSINEVDSKDNVLVQVADFFAGLSVFSKEKFGLYVDWNYEECGQQRLVPVENVEFSKKDRKRFEILSYFKKRCKELKMGVSLDTSEGLWTPRPANSINFWHYEPQSDADKAPTR